MYVIWYKYWICIKFLFYLQKSSKLFKPEPLNLSLLEETDEDDKLDYLLNRRREIVKVRCVQQITFG